MEDTITRIQKMEMYFDFLQNAYNLFGSEVRSEIWFNDLLTILTDYYEGELWKRDFEADEQGMLPADLKRGILSEDGLYNFLGVLEEK